MTKLETEILARIEWVELTNKAQTLSLLKSVAAQSAAAFALKTGKLGSGSCTQSFYLLL
jgi:hypothetical protein